MVSKEKALILQGRPILEKLNEHSGEYVSGDTLYATRKPFDYPTFDKELNILEDTRFVQRLPNSDRYKILKRGKEALEAMISGKAVKVPEIDWRIRHKRIGERIEQYNREQELLKIASICIC